MNRLKIRLNDGKRFLFPAALAAVWVLLMGGANALATTNTVWTVTKSSSNPTCSRTPSLVTTCNTIQSAVTAAESGPTYGDVVVVGPGRYNETVEVSSTGLLTILGAQAGRDARVDRNEPWKESIVDASGTPTGSGGGAGFFVEGDNVIIDGFTIQGGGVTSGSPGVAASGIYVDGVGPDQILNNIIQNNVVGVYLYYPAYNLLKNNLFKNNNCGKPGTDDYELDGPGFGVAAYGPGPADLSDSDYEYIVYGSTSITENAFEENLAAAIYMAYYASWYAVTENTSNKDGSFLVCYDCYYDTFSGNQGRDFGAKGFLPLYGSTNADAAIDIVYYNVSLQINNNVLEGGKTSGYNGIAFDSTTSEADYNCEYCQVSNNQISRFGGSGIVAQPYEDYATLYYCLISGNDAEDNVQDGILIGLAPDNYYNTLVDNKAKGNHVFDCEDDTVDSLTLGTYNTWYNNIGRLSSPPGLCSSRSW